MDLSSHIVDIIALGSVIVIAVLVLLYCLVSFIVNKKFRDSLDSFGDDSVPMTRRQFRSNTFRELYMIWIGRIPEIIPGGSGNGKTGIGREHLLSMVAWLLLLSGIAGFFSKWYRQDFWIAFLLFIVIATFLYAEWKAATTVPEG